MRIDCGASEVPVFSGHAALEAGSHVTSDAMVLVRGSKPTFVFGKRNIFNMVKKTCFLSTFTFWRSKQQAGGQAGRQAKQAGKQASKKGSKQASKQADKQSRQVGKARRMQASRARIPVVKKNMYLLSKNTFSRAYGVPAVQTDGTTGTPQTHKHVF